jgi:hypothetical protein
VMEVGAPLAQSACEPLSLALTPGAHQMLLPAGEKPNRPAPLLPIVPNPDDPARATFTHTERAGIYRMTDPAAAVAAAGEAGAKSADRSVPVAAVNVPPEESSLDRIAPQTVRSLLGDNPVGFTSAQADSAEAGAAAAGGDEDKTSNSGFPLAVPALLLLLAEVIVGWTLGRPAKQVGAAPGKNEKELQIAN